MKVNALRPEGDIFVTPKKGPALYEPNSDFSVITIGTGCPITVMGRSFPCTMIQYKGNYFLVDVGEGTLYRLAEAGIPCGKIKNVFFTNHHADHVAGYSYFAISSWMNGRDELDLVGPPGTRAIHEGFINYYEEDLNYRATLMNRARETTYQANIREIEDKDAFTIDGINITTAKMIHTAHNIAYRFEVDGKSIVVSGDTTFTPALVELARDADILVMDSGAMVVKAPLAGPMKPKEADVSEDLSRCTVPPHPLKGEVARIGREAGVKTMVITHYGPVLVDEEATRAQLKEEGYEGQVIFGRDLMEIGL